MRITSVQELFEFAVQKEIRPTIAVAAAEDLNALETVAEAREAGIAEAVLVGRRPEIEGLAAEVRIDVSEFHIVDAADAADAAEKAIERVSAGECEILMKGAVPTAVLMKKAVEKEYGLRTDRILSHVAAFNSPTEDRLIFLTDAGINIAPDMARKRDIIINAVGVAHALGFPNPKVAALSYVEKKYNLQERSVADAVLLTKMNRAGSIPGCIVDGPFALDNAVSKESARVKGVGGEVAGQADILLAHDLHMGNAIYKALQTWVGTIMAGVVVGGTMPIILTSRADSKESKLHSLALAIVLAGGGING